MRGRIPFFLGTAAAIAALMVLAIPGLSAGVDLGVPGRQAAAPATTTAVVPAASSPQAAAAATNPYQPPLHGANPHGMGSIATVDLAPSDTRPLAADPTGKGDQAPNQEEVILGRARGEQRADGTYHGHITILALAGNEILGVDTNPGQSHHGPLDPLQTQVLDNLCTSSGGALCVNAVTADSTTTSTGSTNHFAVANAKVGSGTSSIQVGVANSNGNISSTSTCQTSHGDSNVASVSAGGGVVANAVQSTSDTKTCNNGQSTAPTATSKVLQLGQNGVPIPAAGCADGTPNTDTGIPVLAPIVCNANDTSTNQTTIPYNVREALTVFLLQTTPGDTAAAKITAGASESAAAAPTATTGTTGTTGTTSGTGTTGTTGTTGSTGSTGTTGSTGSTGSTGTTGTSGTTEGEETTGTTGTTGTSGTTTEGESGETAAQAEESAAAANAQARLAFTGYDVTGAVMLGVLLLAGGLGARRFLGRRSTSAS